MAGNRIRFDNEIQKANDFVWDEKWDEAIASYRDVFGYEILDGPYDDPTQNVSVCFMGSGSGGEVQIELVAPLGESSPVDKLLKKGVSAYHVCYEVDDMDTIVDHLQESKCRLVSPPKPAALHSGRRIAWFFTPTNQLFEVLERAA